MAAQDESNIDEGMRSSGGLKWRGGRSDNLRRGATDVGHRSLKGRTCGCDADRDRAVGRGRGFETEGVDQAAASKSTTFWIALSARWYATSRRLSGGCCGSGRWWKQLLAMGPHRRL